FAADSSQTSEAAVGDLIAEGKRDQMTSTTAASEEGLSQAYAPRPRAQSVDVQTAVLHVSGMPTRLRPAIERAMVQCISTPSEYVVPGDAPLTSQWRTRSYRDHGYSADIATLGAFTGVDVPQPGAEKCVGCLQVVAGTAHELRAPDSVVSALAEEFGFSARVDAA